MADYIATSEELTSIADAIRAKGGTSGPLVFPDGFKSAISAIPAGGGGGSLDHTVTFKDDSGNVVAIYSVISGVGNIAMPSGVTAKKWIDEEGNEVIFPLDPSTDIVITANNNESSVDLIYQTQGVDRSTYPCLFITSSTWNGIIVFAGSFYKTDSALGWNEPAMWAYGFGETTIEDTIYYLINNKVSLKTTGKNAFGISTLSDKTAVNDRAYAVDGISYIDDVVL